jgi:spore coat polysaccharide biosynthesis predicted glycosyltransferase SpsG
VRVLAFDDHAHAGHYHAQLVLNQNLGASAAPYADRAPHTRLLLGPRYALLRREFRDVPERTVADRAERILVTLGGSDPDNLSTRVLAGLAGVPGPLAIQVLVGGANPHGAALEQAAAVSPHRIELVADTRDVAARMLWADLAVAAAGGTARELARVGTPQVSIVLADNQRPAGAALAELGVAVGLGWHAGVAEPAVAHAVAGLIDDRARRAEMAARGRALIDGRGAERVLAAMGLATIVSAA